MAGSSKKQGGKNQKSKKTAKKPASFSRNATTKKSTASKKTTDKKTVNKKTTSKKTTVSKKTTTSKKTASKKPTTKKSVNTNFEEFETLKLGKIDKLDSKIILRDVAKETPIKEPTLKFDNSDLKFKEPETPKLETPKPEAPKIVAPEPLPVFHPVSKPRPTENPVKIPAKELKEQEIKKAVNTAAKMPTSPKRRERKVFGDFGLTRVFLAAACITTAVFAVVYFVNLTSSNMSIQVAASQSGINAKYPAYVPRGYEMSDVTSSSGKVSMRFKGDDGEFIISEENSSWDSEGLLNNFIKPTYNNDYTVVREQGLTLYMGANWQVWVNGGMLYKLNITSGTLTKKQLKAIATSL